MFVTESEAIFAAYLDNANYRWDYEPDIPSHYKKPDFRISRDGVEILSDVKERSPTEFIPGARHIDPVEGIRKLIEKGREKFKSFGDHICAIIVYNNGDHDTRLESMCIFEAMVGNLGFQASFVPDTGRIDLDSVQSVFLPRGGKMIKHYPTMEPYDSTRNISAIIALESYRIQNPLFAKSYDQQIDRRTTELGRPLTVDERCTIQYDLMFRGIPATLGETSGVTVCTNPFAKHPFPDDIFNGPYDERWSMVDGQLTRVFVGVQRLALGQKMCQEPIVDLGGSLA
jgi:hypothetical protein